MKVHCEANAGLPLREERACPDFSGDRGWGSQIYLKLLCHHKSSIENRSLASLSFGESLSRFFGRSRVRQLNVSKVDLSPQNPNSKQKPGPPLREERGRGWGLQPDDQSDRGEVFPERPGRWKLGLNKVNHIKPFWWLIFNADLLVYMVNWNPMSGLPLLRREPVPIFREIEGEVL